MRQADWVVPDEDDEAAVTESAGRCSCFCPCCWSGPSSAVPVKGALLEALVVANAELVSLSLSGVEGVLDDGVPVIALLLLPARMSRMLCVVPVEMVDRGRGDHSSTTKLA